MKKERELERRGRVVGRNKRQDEPRARKSSWIRVGAAAAAASLPEVQVSRKT